MKTKIKKAMFTVGIFCVFFLLSCGQAEKYPKCITVTYVQSPLNIPSMVEKEMGFFEKSLKEYDIQINYANITNGSEQTQALASGDVQLLFAVGAPSVILSAANGNDIKIIAAYSSQPKAYQIITGNDAIKAPEDLIGKTIAGPKGTSLNELLVAYLKQHEISVEQVKYVSMSIGEAQAALEAGQADAALLAGANAYSAVQSGYRILTDGDGLIDGVVLVAVSGKFAKEYPELIEAFLKAQKEALDYIEENEAEALQLAKRETGLDDKAVKAMYEYYDFHRELTERDIESIRKTIAFMKEAEMIEENIEADELLLEEICFK